MIFDDDERWNLGFWWIWSDFDWWLALIPFDHLLIRVRGCNWGCKTSVWYTKTALGGLGMCTGSLRTLLERFQTKSKNRWFWMMMAISWILMDLGRFWVMISFDPFWSSFDQSEGVQLRMENIGLVYKNSSRRSRNVHRVAQNTPRMFPDQI